MSINRFEEIKAWQEARKLTKNIYAIIAKGKFARDFSLRDQIQRAATSIMANVSEGFDLKSRSEIVQFLFYSKRSASEVQSHLYVAKDQGYITPAQFNILYAQTSQVKNLVGGFIRYLLQKSVNAVTV